MESVSTVRSRVTVRPGVASRARYARKTMPQLAGRFELSCFGSSLFKFETAKKLLVRDFIENEDGILTNKVGISPRRD